MLSTAAWLVAIVMAAWAIARLAGARRWAAISRAIHARLDRARDDGPASVVDLAALDALPPPVARYLRAVLRDGQAHVRHVQLSQQGRFNLSAEGERWLAFDADQRVQVRRPGFDWNARMRLAPGLPIRVHDAYADGTGWLRASLLGLFDVADLAGGGGIAEGELMRWLAEAPWYPTALLPGGRVQWQAVDEHSALATVADAGVRVSLLFRFGDDGLVTGVHAPARSRSVGGHLVPTPWEGRFTGYAVSGGMRVPTRGEVGWYVEGRYRPYWRGRTLRADYD